MLFYQNLVSANKERNTMQTLHKDIRELGEKQYQKRLDEWNSKYNSNQSINQTP